MGKYLKMIFALFITTTFSALILSCVYRATKPGIDKAKSLQMEEDLKMVIDADRFIPILPETLFLAIKGSDTIGIVFRVFPRGYADKIPITVGLNNEGVITGIKIASPAEGLRETPGLGTKISDKEFIRQFIGKDTAGIRLKKDGGMIDAITGATISSRAVVDGVRNGMKHYQNYLVRKDLRRELFPDGEKFVPIIEDSSWLVYNGSGQIWGIVFMTRTIGYCGEIRLLVGIDQNKKIVGVKIVEQHETECIGSRIVEDDFLKQFVSKAKFETISGATISSSAVIDAVKKGVERYRSYLKK